MSSNVSASVSDGLIKGLQTDIANLRDDNKKQERLLALEEQKASRFEAKSAELEHENHVLREQVDELQRRLSFAAASAQTTAAAPTAAPPQKRKSEGDVSSAAAPPPAAAEVIEAGIALEREICHALEEALLGSTIGGEESFEMAAGAARRRSIKTSSTIVTAAVRTAKRAQAVWAAEHGKLREEMREAQRAENARRVELEECQALLRRLRLELNTSRRGLQDARDELKQAEVKVRDAEQQQQMHTLDGEDEQ